MVGPGLPFDTEKYFIICPNVIGGCQGSTGPSSIAPDGKRYGSRFPTVTVRDMAEAEILFSDAIGIKKYRLAVGPSLGGMRSLEWAIEHPDRVSAICTIGSSAVATGDQIGGFSVQIRAIKSDPNFNDGDYYDQEIGPVEGMGIARKDMPQIPGKERARFLEEIEKSDGITVEKEKVDPTTLKPIQKEISAARSGAIYNKFREDGEIPKNERILISKVRMY